MKILILNWRDRKHPDAGGAEKATHEIGKRWVQKGHEVSLIAGHFGSSSPEEIIDGIRVKRLGGKYSIYPLTFLYYLTRARGNFDIVIDEINTVPFFTPLYVEAPKVAFIHQLAANVLFEELPGPQAHFWHVLEPRILRRYHRTPIVTSESTKQDLIYLGLPAGNIHTIKYGVDREVYRPGKKSGEPKILYVGRLKRFKGLHHLIQATKIVSKKVPNVKLEIIGSGDSAYEEELLALGRKLGLEGNLTFRQLTFDQGLRHKVEAYQQAWVLACPSIREGFGLTVIEANACGTPAVASNVQGLRDTVSDQRTGLLVAPRDVSALSEALMKVLLDDGLRRELSRQAVEWSGKFDWDETAGTMLGVIEATLGKRYGQVLS